MPKRDEREYAARCHEVNMVNMAESGEDPLPQDYSFGQELDWDADSIQARAFVELPYWLMVGDCTVNVEINSHSFPVQIRSGFFEMFAHEVRDSKASCIRIGSNPTALPPDVVEMAKDQQIPMLPRKCKTVLEIASACNSDAYAALDDDGRRRHMGSEYFRAFCGAHLAVVNRLIQQYRLATYDYQPYEVSPWDVPIWRVDGGRGYERVVLVPYSGWDYKPWIGTEKEQHEYSLIEPSDLQNSLHLVANPGEYELLDALNLIERGDYSGAIRRVTTAIEAILYARLIDILIAQFGESRGRTIHSDLRDQQTKQIDRFQSLSPQPLSDVLLRELKETRKLRHEIVHHARRITYAERGSAHRAVDTGRWIYNRIEDDASRRTIREQRIGMRSIGKHFSILSSRITEQGVVVDCPSMPDIPNVENEAG
jgi:hypothetical protein